MSETMADVLSLAKVVALFTALISGIYVLVIPALFSGYKTSSVLILGIGAAALLGGFIGYRLPPDDTLPAKIALGVCCATAVAILVTFLSMLIILNVLGS